MYEDFEMLRATMNAAGYKLNEEYKRPLAALARRKSGGEFSMSEHMRAMIYAMLSGESGWARVESKLSKIDEIFYNYDVEKIKAANPDMLDSAIRAIRAGNKQITYQMRALKPNIETLERIAAEHGSVDKYYNSTDKYKLVRSLAQGKYKLQRMEVALVAEYLKSVGVDTAKPDRHVNRLIGHLGYSKHSPAKPAEAFAACEGIAKEYNLTNIEVDAVLWQYCAEGRFEKCSENPKCAGCLVKNCKGRKA